MIVTVFRSRLRDGAREAYGPVAARMDELVRTMPGYVSHKGFAAEDGERVTIVEFESEEAVRAWRMHPEHREAQRNGRALYYEAFNLQVCEVVRSARFERSETKSG